MTNPEPLYIIVVRDNAAENKLKTWAQSSPHNRASVDGNRLRIFDHHTWHRFRVTWIHGFNQLSVWDSWNRRHVDIV